MPSMKLLLSASSMAVEQSTLLCAHICGQACVHAVCRGLLRQMTAWQQRPRESVQQNPAANLAVMGFQNLSKLSRPRRRCRMAQHVQTLSRNHQSLSHYPLDHQVTRPLGWKIQTRTTHHLLSCQTGPSWTSLHHHLQMLGCKGHQMEIRGSLMVRESLQRASRMFSARQKDSHTSELRSLSQQLEQRSTCGMLHIHQLLRVSTPLPPPTF